MSRLFLAILDSIPRFRSGGPRIDQFLHSLLPHPSMSDTRVDLPGQHVRLACAPILAMVLVVAPGLAQNRPQVSLDTSETLFTVLTAVNTCGYDQELNSSDPLRTEIRSEVAQAVENTAGAHDV